MALKLYEESDILAIANGVRGITGETGTYTVAQMASALNDYWGDSTLAMSGVNADGTPFTQTDEHRWGSTSLLTPNNDVEIIRYCTGFIELPAGATLRIKSAGLITSLFITLKRSITATLDASGYAQGNTLKPRGINSLIYKNDTEGLLWVRINSTVPISEVKMKIIEGDDNGTETI